MINRKKRFFLNIVILFSYIPYPLLFELKTKCRIRPIYLPSHPKEKKTQKKIPVSGLRFNLILPLGCSFFSSILNFYYLKACVFAFKAIKGKPKSVYLF